MLGHVFFDESLLTFGLAHLNKVLIELNQLSHPISLNRANLIYPVIRKSHFSGFTYRGKKQL